jgi:large subunit ribosomal protein L32
MAVPKKKISKMKRRKRRTHKKLTAVALVPCGHCNTPKASHTVCPNCGYYAGRAVVHVEEK